MTGFVYELIYVLIISGIYISVTATYLGTEHSIPVIVAGTLIACAMVAFRKLGWYVRFIMAGVLVTVILTVLLLTRNPRIGEVLIAHAYLLLFLIPVAAAFITGELCAHFRAFRAAAAVAAIILSVTAVCFGIIPGRVTVMSVLALVLTAAVEEIQLSWVKDGYTDHKEHLVWVAPYLLVTMILVCATPAPDEAYDWAFVKELYRMAYDRVQEISALLDIKGAYDPTGAMIGFSGRGRIHDEVNAAPDEMLTLYDIPMGMTDVKLAGRTFDTFDGYEWTDTDTSDAPDVILDTLSLLSSVRDYTAQPQDYVKKSSLRIRYEDLGTPYVFIPLKALADSRELTEAGVRELGGDLLWPEVRSFKTEYTVNFYRMNTGNELFEEYLRNCRLPGRESFDAEAHMFTPAGSGPYTYDDLTGHVERIEAVYARPVELSGDMTHLMEDVYDGAEDMYDKMAALEAYLRSLDYSDSPGPLPDDMEDASDFLDSFVLGSRCGYCTHFATAFVLLARAEGIPARYVQGYIVDTTSAEPVTVDSSMAHAWPEVYYEGAGWVAYEPTPIYHVRSYWRSAEETKAMYMGASGAYPGSDEEVPEDMTEEPEDDEDAHIRIPWYAIVIPVAAGIALTVLFIVAGNLIVSYRFRRRNAEERLEILCRQDLNLLSLLECEMESGETLNEYRMRLHEELDDESLGFISYYSEYLYRGETDTDKALEVSGTAYTKLKDKLKKLYPLRYLRLYMGFQRI